MILITFKLIFHAVGDSRYFGFHFKMNFCLTADIFNNSKHIITFILISLSPDLLYLLILKLNDSGKSLKFTQFHLTLNRLVTKGSVIKGSILC